jgi:hypothetical protein
MQSNNCGQMIAAFGKVDCPCQVRVSVGELDFLHNNPGISFDTPDIRRPCLPTQNRPYADTKQPHPEWVLDLAPGVRRSR